MFLFFSFKQKKTKQQKLEEAKNGFMKQIKETAAFLLLIVLSPALLFVSQASL